MEEILASIRRIIADDEAASGVRANDAVQASSLDPSPSGLASGDEASAFNSFEKKGIRAILAGFDKPEDSEGKFAEEALEMEQPALHPTSPVAIVDGAVTSEQSASPQDDAALVQEKKTTESAGTGTAPTISAHEPSFTDRVEEALLAPEAGNAVANAFSSLTNTILDKNARTLDDLVQDMLRPMLKSWLDDNLPAVVERLVRAEIERVSRGPRR